MSHHIYDGSGVYRPSKPQPMWRPAPPPTSLVRRAAIIESEVKPVAPPSEKVTHAP